MGISIKINRERSLKAAMLAKRLDAYAKGEEGVLYRYTLPPKPPISKCSHGVMTEGKETASFYCTICRDIRVEHPPRRRPYRMDAGHPLRLGLKTWPRRGVRKISKAFHEIAGEEFLFTASDHDTAPRDEFVRMFEPEKGGYINEGGTASRAAQPTTKQGFAWDSPDDRGSRKLGIGFAKMLAPWEYERKDAQLFQRRLFNPVVRPELQHHTGPVLVYIGVSAARSHQSDWREGWKKPQLAWDEIMTPFRTRQEEEEWSAKRKAEGRESFGRYLCYRERGVWLLLWGCLMEEPLCTDKQIAEWWEKYWNEPRRVWNPKLFRREPWCSCRACMNHWDSNRSEDWRDDRTMRDLTARLDLENYGWEPDADLPNTIIPPRYNIARVTAKVNARLYPAFVTASRGKGITVKQTFWPVSETHPSVREQTSSGAGFAGLNLR